VQLWVALPPQLRRCPPAFEHHAVLPRLAEGRTAITLLAGRLGGMISPATTHSPLIGLDVDLPSGGRVRLPLDPGFEHAVLAMEGSADAAGHAFGPGELLYLGDGRHHLDLSSDEPARLLLLGGPPLEAPLAMWWNFVGTDLDELERARRRWEQGGFGQVPGASLPPQPAPSPGPRG
jgi:redox-sensitive bicupin YhaK (pirin superfamily)